MGRAWVAVFVSLAVVAASGPASARSGASAEAGPGITVTFLPAPSPTVVGRPVFMPIRVVNTATGQTLAVTLTVQAPVWVRLAGPRCTARRGSLVCPIRDLAPRASVTVRVRVTSTRLGSFRIQAQAVARAAEPADTSGSSERTLAATTGFQGSVLRITPVLARRMTGVSWRPGCPVALENLRVLRLSYWDFTGRVRTGTLVVNRDAAAPLLRVFGRLYAARYPIRRMTPVDAYGGDDYRSIEDDNTSAFNCRPATGSTHWSEHAYGRAVDLDPLENPYVSGGTTSHAASRRYLDRSRRLPGMIHSGDVVVRAFAAEGWGWGGAWSGTRDYQHFSASGR